MAPKKPKDTDIKNKIKKAKSSSDKNVIQNNIELANKEIKKIKKAKTTNISEKVSLMTSFALAKISNSLADTADKLSDMATSTTENIIDGVKEYTSAITEEFGVNKQSMVAMSLAQISPVFGHFVSKFMETTVFRNMVDKFKEKFVNTISLTSRGLFNLMKLPLQLPKKLFSGSKNIFKLFGRSSKEKRETNKLKNIPKLARGGIVKKSGLAHIHAGEMVAPLSKLKSIISDSSELTKLYQEQSLRELTFIRTAVNKNLPGLFQRLWSRFQENHNKLAKTLKASFYIATAPFRVIRWALKSRGGYRALLPTKPDLINVLGTSFVWSMTKFDSVIEHLREIIISTRDTSSALTGKSYGPMPNNPTGKRGAFRGGRKWTIAGEAWKGVKAPFILGKKIFNKFSKKPGEQEDEFDGVSRSRPSVLAEEAHGENLNVKRNIILSAMLNKNKSMDKSLKGILNNQTNYNKSFKNYSSDSIDISKKLLKKFKGVHNYLFDIGKYLLTALMLLGSFAGKIFGNIGGKIFGGASHILGGIIGGKILGKVFKSGAGKVGGKALSVGGRFLGPAMMAYEGYEGYNKKEEWFKDRKIGKKEKVASAVGGAIGGTTEGKVNAISQGLKMSTVGSLAGGGIGFLIGGPPGALIGSRIGAVVGGIGGAASGYVGGEKIAKEIAGEKQKDKINLENIKEKTGPIFSSYYDKLSKKKDEINEFYEGAKEKGLNDVSVENIKEKFNKKDIRSMVKNSWNIITEPFSHLKGILKSAKQIEENVKSNNNIKELEIEMGTAPARISASIVGGTLDILSTIPYAENASLILKDKYEQLRRSIGMMGGEKLETPKDKYRSAVAGFGDLAHNLLFAATGVGKSAMTGLGTLASGLGPSQAHAATIPGMAGGMGGGITGGTVAGGTITAGGAVHSNIALVANKLMEAGLSKEAAAGVIGNLQHESGNQNLDPNARNKSGAFGIAQWLSKDRVAGLNKLAQDTGRPVNDIGLQADFLIQEMKTGSDSGAKKAYELLKNAKTPEEASDIFFKYFERAGDSSGAKRQGYARNVLQGLMSAFSPNQAHAATIPMGSTVNAPTFSQAVGTLSSGGMKAANCGDAAAALVNSELSARGLGNMLPRGGLDSGSIIRAANNLGAPILRGEQITLQNLMAMGPGTIIRYARNSGHQSKKYGDDHAETIAINPQTNQLGILSYSAGRGAYWKPLTEEYVRNEYLSNTSGAVASNLLSGQGGQRTASAVQQGTQDPNSLRSKVSNWYSGETQTPIEQQQTRMPAMDVGGYINKTQPILAHKGEIIAPIEKVGSAFVDAAAKSGSFLKNLLNIKSPDDIFRENIRGKNPKTSSKEFDIVMNSIRENRGEKPLPISDDNLFSFGKSIIKERPFNSSLAKEIMPGEIDIDRGTIINSRSGGMLANRNILQEIVSTIGTAISSSLGQLKDGIGSVVNNAINMVSNNSQQVSSSASGGNNSQPQDFGINIDNYIAQILRGDLD